MPDMHPADMTDHVKCKHCGVIEYHCDDCGKRCWSDDEEEELCSDCFGIHRDKKRIAGLEAENEALRTDIEGYIQANTDLLNR